VSPPVLGGDTRVVSIVGALTLIQMNTPSSLY
jgi:hypothetical protein